MQLKRTLRNAVVAGAIAVLTATSSPFVAHAQAQTTPSVAPHATEVADEDSAEIDEATSLDAGIDATDISSTPTTSTIPTTTSNKPRGEKESLVVEKQDDGTYAVKIKVPAREAGTDPLKSVITLKRDANVGPLEDIFVAKFGDKELPSAYASSDLMETDFDLYSIDVLSISTQEDDVVSFRYLPADPETSEKEQARSWALAEESDSNAFIEGIELGGANVAARMPVAAMARASVNNSPHTPYEGSDIPTGPSFKGNNSNDYNPDALKDPDFGVQYEQNPGHMSYKDKGLKYPIRHRNWCTDYYNASGDRPLRGPNNPQSQGASGLDCLVHREGEQGSFYSRDHVQYAWAPEGDNKTDPFYRAHEFLIGGGDENGVWYGGRFRAPSGLAVPSWTYPVWDVNYRDTQKPGFQVYIDGVLNTDDPGWRYIQQPGNNGGGLYFISPDGKLGIRLESAGGGAGVGARTSMNFRFYNHEKMVKDKMIDDTTGEFSSSFLTFGKSDEYRIGINTPGWRRTVIRYGTEESGKDYEPVSKVNGYRTAGFIPQSGSGMPQTASTMKIEKTVVERPNEAKAWAIDNKGRKYIDYQLKVAAPKQNRQQYFWYKVRDTPVFAEGLVATDFELLSVQNKSKGDYRMTVENAGTKRATVLFDAAVEQNSNVATGLGRHRYLQIAQNREHILTIRVFFKEEESYKPVESSECSLSGLDNRGYLIMSDGSEYEDNACAPYRDPEPRITKRVVGQWDEEAQTMKSWSQDAQGRKFIEYEIAVSLPGNYSRAPKYGSPYFWYKVVDTPNFGPNIKVNSLEIVDVVGKGKGDYQVVAQNAGTPNPTFTLQQTSPNRSQDHLQIRPGRTHFIHTRVYFETVNGANVNTIGECRPGNGLYNKVTLNFEKEDVATDEACGNDEEKVEPQFGVLKVDHTGQFLSIDSGFNFEVKDPQGNVVQLNEVKATGGVDGNNRPLSVLMTEKGSMATDVRYQLVETRAPKGHELLAEPIYFRIVRDISGQFKLEVENLQNHPQIVIRDDRRALGQNVVSLHVADIRSGDLPQSGGSGVYWQLALGFALSAAAVALYAPRLRKRN